MDEQTIFLTALDKGSPAERTAYLDEVCGGNVDLKQRIVALLTRYDDAGSFLERPPSELDATAMGVDDTHEDGNPASDVRTTLYDSSEDVSLDFLHPSAKPGCLGTIGQYEVQSVIGRGGMGVVLKAHDTRLHRTVAVKVLAPELAVNPTAKQRFIREARAAAAVTNPHVVTTHAVDEDRVPYIVMELVDGKTLREKLDTVGMLGVKEILRIGSQIAHGLAAAHKQGLIHRDIKPGNILLENGVERVKITDFGLARAVDDLSVTRTGEVAGTPQYMSPEQAQGEGVDHRSDLFSLGSVLYAMCTGRPPFRGDNAIAVIRRVVDESPRPIREVNAEIPEWLCDIINKLLAKKPEERYQTAKEVASVLEESLARLQHPIAASHPPQVTAQTPPAPNVTAERTTPHRTWRIATGVVGAVVVLAGIIIKITSPDGTTVEIEADSGSRIEITSDDSTGGARTIVVDDSPTVPSGSSADILTSSDWEWIEAENLGPVINSPQNEGGPTLTADGLTLVFHSNRDDGFGRDDLWISTRDSVDDEWSMPTNLGSSVNTVFDESNASISADGLILMFESDINSGLGNNDLWMTTRPSQNEPWSPPMNLSELNTDSFEIGPALSADRLSLVFTSGRSGNTELWETNRTSLDAPWSPPRNLGPTLNSPAFQGWAELSRDGLSLIFNSNRTGGNPAGPSWIATRPTTSHDWSAPVRLQPQEQMGAWSPCLSGDNTLMLFDSRRAGGQGNGDFDIWMTRRVPKNGALVTVPGTVPIETPPQIAIPIGESPLDQLDPALIPEAERFDWQPEELVAVIGSHARRHWWHGYSVAISPDGTQVATGDAAGVSILWDVATQTERLRLPLLNVAPVLSLQFSPDGSRLVDNWGRVFDVSGTVAVPVPLADGVERFPCNAPNSGHIYICEAGSTLLYCGTDGECLTFDFAALNPEPQGQLTIDPFAVGATTHFVATEANELIYLAADGTWRHCRIENQQFVDDAPFPVAMDPGDHVFGISPDGRRTVIWKQGNMELWDVAQSPPVLAVTYEQAFNWPVTFSADGRWMAVKYTSTFLFRTDSPEIVAVLDQTDRGAFGSVVFSRDGNLTVVLNSEGFVRFWDLSGEEPTELSPFDAASGFIPPSSHSSPALVHGTGQIVLPRYDLGAGYFVRHQFWNLAGVVPTPTPDGETFLDASQGYRVLPIDAEHVVVNFAFAEEGPPLRYRFDGIRWRPDGEPFGEAYVTGGISHNGQFLVTIPRDTRRELVGWDLSTEIPVRLWTLPLPFNAGTFGVVQPLAMSANQQVLAVFVQPDETGSGGALHVVRNPTTEPSIAHTLPITSDRGRYRMALSPDGRYVAHLQRSRMEIVLTDISGSEPSEVWRLNLPQYIHWLSYAPDGRHVAFGGNNGVGILEVPRMELVWEWAAPGPVSWVEWADDSRHLITHNANKTVYVLRLNQLAE